MKVETLWGRPLKEVVSKYADDVMKTGDNLDHLKEKEYFQRYLEMDHFFPNDHLSMHRVCLTGAIYDFLFGGGSLGYESTSVKVGYSKLEFWRRPTLYREGVLKVAELVGTEIALIAGTFAVFGEQINQEAVERAFYPIWEMEMNISRRIKRARFLSTGEITGYEHEARFALSQIHPWSS